MIGKPKIVWRYLLHAVLGPCHRYMLGQPLRMACRHIMTATQILNALILAIPFLPWVHVPARSLERLSLKPN